MTSTNDGKYVKSNNLCGQKGKSHYIELYKSLDANLNCDCDLGTLTGYLCDAWRRVHSLCAHSAPSTHPHLLAWTQRHTARTVLQTQWQSPSSSDYHTTLDQTLQDFIQEAGDAIVARNGQCLQWESQLLERAVWFRSVLSNPWEHHVLKALLDAKNEQPTDDEVLEWLKEERGITFVTRLRQLALSKGCDDLALTLASAVMDRIRASVVVVPDMEQLDDMREKPPSPESGPTFEKTLRSEAGFSQDVLDLLADIELVLLHKRDRDPQCINLAKATPLRMGHALVERLAGRLDQAPREKKLWKNARHVAAIVARVIIARCMVVSCCVGVARTALYWCARSIARLVDGDRLPTVASALAAPAATARHLHTLATANHAQLAELEDRRGFVCELYIRAITSGMNELEKLKLDTTPEKEKEARQTEQTLASWFIQLGTLLSGSARVKCECMLTAFSVHPSPAMYERIKQAPVLPPLTLESSEIKQEDQSTDPTSDFGSWANDSRQQSNLVKTSQIVNIKSTENLANVVSTALFTEGEKLGLSAELCQDLAVLLARPRVKTFSWDMEREILLDYCRSYMDRTSGGTKCLTTELKYLNLDPKTYQHLPEEQEDEDDIYYGIQKGYEHLVEFEPQPEEIWQDAHLTQQEESAESEAESDANDETYTTYTRRKKKTRHSSESDSDPLSEVAKAKHDQKKERSKEPKKRGKKDPNKQKVKKEPKEKQPKKERQQKQPKNYLSDLSKPVKSELSKFLGFKVVNMSFEDEFRNSLQMTQMDPLGTVPDPLAFNTSKPNKKALTKSTRLGTPVTDSDYDSQGKSSRKSETPEPEASNKNFPVDDLIKSLQKRHNEPNPAVKDSISKLLQYRKQKAEERKNSASKDNSLAALVGSKIFNKQPIMLPDFPDTPKTVLGNKSDAVSKSMSTNTSSNAKSLPNKSDASSKSMSTNTSSNAKFLPNKPVDSKDSSSASEKKPRKPRKPSTKKIIKDSLNTNSQTSSSLQLATKTPTQKPASTISAPFAKASFDPNQNSYQRFLMELQQTKRNALQGNQDPKPAPKKTTLKIISTGETTKSAKPTQQKMETPNTFARRNHMHKTNKKIIQHQESLQFSVSRELDQRIANLTQKKMKDLQNANDLSISPFIPNDVLNVHFNAMNSSRFEPRVEIQKVEEPTPASSLIAANHHVTSNVLEGSVVTVARNPAYVSPKPDQSKMAPGDSALSEQDQKDVLRLLMQQNKLNAKVESLAIGNTSILNSPKLYPAKNDSMNDQNQIQKPNLIYGSSITQETMESPVIPHKTVIQTANMVQSPKPAAKRKPKVKNCPKKDIQSPRSLSANTSPIISKAPANTNLMVLKTYSNPNQNETTTAYNFTQQAASSAYKSQITAPLSENTNQTLTRQVLLASQISPTISTSGSHISIEPIKTTGDMTATSSGVTSNLKANKVQTPYQSVGQRKENWASVLDGLLKLKTPCRGPIALDMALKHDSKDTTTESLRQLRIVKSNSRSVSLERPLVTKPEKIPGQSSQDLPIPTTNMEKPGIKNSPEPFTKDTFLEANKAVDDMIKKLDRKAKRRSRAKVKVPDQPLMEELVVRKPNVQYPKKDPIPEGFTRSDYDIMLGELLDDDLLQEIDESPVQCSRQNDPKNMNFNTNLAFSKPEERNMTIPAYGTTIQETQIPVTQNLQSVPNTINEKGPVQNSKHIKMVFNLPPNPEIVKVLPKEKPRILSNVPISIGSPGIKNVLDKNAPLIIKPPDKTIPKIQHPNEIVLKMKNANPVKNQAQPKIFKGVQQSVFLVGSKNYYETLTIYGQSENETVPPLISANANLTSNSIAKTNAQTILETVNTAAINKQGVNNQVVIKAPYPTVVGQTVKTTPESVNTAAINKQAVNTQVVIKAPYPTSGQTIKTTPETVNTASINKQAGNNQTVIKALYPTVVSQTVKTTPESVNTAAINKQAVNTQVVIKAPYPTSGQTIKTTPETVNTASINKQAGNNQTVIKALYPTVVSQTVKTTPESVNTAAINKQAVNTQVVIKAPYPTSGQTIKTTPETVNTASINKQAGNNQTVIKALYPTVVSQTVKTTPESVNTAAINKQAVNTQVVIKAPYPIIGQTIKTTPETVNTASINKQAGNNQVVIKAPYPTVVGQTVKTTLETANTASINKQAVNTSVVFNAPYPTVGQTVKTRPETLKIATETVNSASKSVNKHAVNTSVVFNAPYPTVGQTINIPMTPNVKEPSSNQSVHRSAYPVVGQTIKMATSNKYGSNVHVTPTPEDKAQVTITTKPKTVMEATPKLKPAVIEFTPKLQQNSANTTNPVIKNTTKLQQNIRNSAKLALVVEATQKLQQNITTNTTKPASVVEATPKILHNLTNTTKAACVIEATPELQQNIANITKPVTLIEDKPKLQQNIENTTTKQNVTNTTKPESVIEATPKYHKIPEAIPKQNIANQNEDNAKINSDRKVLSEVPEKPNTPSKIDVKKNTLLDGEMKKENQERLIKKRLSIINRQVDHRCFYPPIPLTYAPIIIKTNLQKNDSVKRKEKGVKKSKSVSKLSEDKKACITKGTLEDLAPTRVSKRIEMTKAKRMLAKKIIEEEQVLINKFIDESLGSAAIDETASEIKNTMSSDIPEYSKPTNDIPKHSDLSDKNINKSTDEKLDKLVSAMATTIDIITKSTVEPVVTEDEEPFVIQTARETLLKDPLGIESPVVLPEQTTATTTEKNQISKTKVIATKPLELTNVDPLPKVTDNSHKDLEKNNLLNNVTRKDPYRENAQILENDVIDAQKFKSKDAIVKEEDTKVEKQPSKDSTEVIDLDSDSDTEKEKLKPKDEVLTNHQIHEESSNASNEPEIWQSLKDSITITELPSGGLGPFKRQVKITKPNNKSFCVTITGKYFQSYDDLFAMPEIRSALLNESSTKLTMRVPLAPLVPLVPLVPTVNLLSDDEDTYKQKQPAKTKVRPQYFVTEFGKFRASDHLDKQMLSQHQQRFSQKCFLKLQRCKEPDIQDDSELIEESIDLLTPPPTANREKSDQETEDSEPYVLPEVIDLDDSSNDSVVAVEGVQVPNVAPVKKINKFKNLLIKELFSDDMLNLNPDDLLNPKSEQMYDDSNSVVTILSSELSTIDAPIQKQDYAKIIDKECVIQLTRCDDMVNYYKHKVTESTLDDISEDIATVTNDLDLTSPLSSPVITRNGSFSILNELDLDTVVHSPVIDMFQAISDLHDIDKARREEVTSPVMQAYDIIAAVDKKVELQNEKTVQTICETDWFFTKPKLKLLAIRHHLDENTEDQIVMDSILDESTYCEDSFNTEQAQNIQIKCDMDWFMTKLEINLHTKNFDKCEIVTTTVDNILDYSTDCEDITDCSETELDTETAVKNSPSLQTIMANYFADNPIVNYMQHIARPDQNATMSPLKRKSTLAVTKKSNKMSRRFAPIVRSSDSRIADFTTSPALFEKPNHALVPECKELDIAEKVKLTITQTLNVDQNDNDYLLGQKYTAGHNIYDVSKQRIDKAEETDKTISEHEDPDPRVEPCATEPIIEISDSMIKQDNADPSAKIPGPRHELCPETAMKLYDTLSVEPHISEPLKISASLGEQDKPSSPEPIAQIADPKNEPCAPETTMEITDIPCGSESIVIISDSRVEQDQLSEPISVTSGQKDDPCMSETTMEIADTPSVNACASEPILENSDTLKQDQPAEPVAEIIDQNDEPSILETTMEIADTPSDEPVKECVSESVLEDTKSLDKLQETPSSPEPIAQIPDQKDEPCVPEITVDIPYGSESILEIADSIVKQDQPSEPISETPNQRDEPCVPVTTMENLDLLAKVCIFELMSKDVVDTTLQGEQSTPELIIKDTELRHEVSVPEPVLKDRELLKVSVSQNVLENTKLQDSSTESQINPKGPISELRNVPSINLSYLRDNDTTNYTKSEISIENIDWIGHECVIKSDSNSANSSFESISTLPFDDGKNYLWETKTEEKINEKELVLITSNTSLEHAYEKVLCSYSTGDDTGVVLKKVDSEPEDPFLGFELNTKSDCSDLLERSMIEVITYTEIDEEKPLEREKLYDDDKELTLVTPKVTYSMKCRKRKSDGFTMLGNTKRARRTKSTDSNVSLGRKRKSIDARKLSVSAVNEQSYCTEFERLINYYDTIDLSYSLSFDVEQIDATELLKNWPIKDEYKIYDGEIEVVELFTDDSEMKPREFEIDKQTFAEEINAAIEQKIEAFDEADDTNFNKGFGERSGRVIQDLEQFGATSKLSAATLSDVKQYQPFLLSENIYTNINSNEQIILRATEDYEMVHRFMTSVNIHRKIKQFFKNSSSELNKVYENLNTKDDKMTKARFPFEKYISGYFKQSPVEITVGVVQVGQLPVSAAAQNPVTCDPRVTHVSDASPSQCSENSPSDDPEQSNKTEYTELTTADLSMPIIGQEYTHSDVPVESQDSFTPCENITIESSLIQSDIRIELEEESPEEGDIKIKTEPVIQNNNDEFSSEDPDTNSPTQSDSNAQFVTLQQQCQESIVTQNVSTDKSDQIAQAMNVAGITNEEEATATANRTRALVDLLTQSISQTITTQNSTMTFPKTTTINAMSLQQALAQILPPPLNQTGENQQVPTSVPQVLHIVHNNAGGNLTLVDGSQQSVINSNSTPMIHIVQNKVSNGCPSNGVPAQQQNNFSGISLVDAGLQQGGGQLLHIVNTGSQKNPNTGQLLKRVNLLTNLTNVQGNNEQKMLQFVCKSADGKSIQLSSPHQRSMVLRLQPIETLDVQNAQKQTESQDLNSIPNNNIPSKESASQQEIKSRSVYEENYAKFIQNSSLKPGSEKSTSLPKFNQAFGKPVFQDGSEKSSDTSTSDVHLSSSNSNEINDVQTSENTINLDHITGINNPPLLLRKTTAQVSQAQPNLVQQIKQAISPMNIQAMHGGVIYTRQIPVNIGGGQTINLISVPTTELADESGQKQPEVQFVKQGDIDGSPSIIKIVPQIPAPNAEVSEDGSVNLQNDGQNPQPQPVLTQMRIKLPMLSKNPQMIAGARVVRPSFFQIQRNVIGGANQPVYQQLVLTAAPQLGQQTIRLPQAQQVRQVKVPDNQSPPESQMSSSTLEQLREFDMVLEQVKERSTVQPNSGSSSTLQGNKTSTDTTDSPVSTSSKPTETKQVLYTIGGSHSVAYVNRKATVTTSNTPSFSRSPDSSGIVDSPSSSSHTRHSATSETPQTTQNDGNPTPTKSKSHKSKSKSKSSSHSSHSSSKVSTAVAHKPSTQKPLEDEQTTQRILYILAEYKEQVENSPDKDKPAPRRRTNPPSNSGSRRKKRRSGARDLSPAGDDSRTIGSEDSSCGTSQGDCAESCVDSVSPQSSPRKVVRKLTFDPDATPNATSTTPIRPQPPRNVIVTDGQTLAVTRGASGKPATAVIMPANYLLPVSMVKGGQQIAIVTNQGPKLLTVTGGESPAANALLLQRLIGPAVKPVLARPGIRHVRLPTAALQRIQTFNLAPTATAAANNSTAADSTASPAPEPTKTPEDPQSCSPPWADKESESKPDRASSPEGSEPWNLPSSADPNDYSYEETVRTDNLDRTVLEAIPDRYSPDMEAHRIFDKMFDVESKKCYVDSPHRYDIDAVDEDKTYQVVHKKDLSAARQHRLAYISAAALRHKHAILEHELRLQKSLSEECEDLGVDSPSASDLFPEAELLFGGSPAADHGHERDHDQPAPAHHPPQPTILNETLHANIEEQIATDQLLPREDRGINLGLEDVGIVTVSEDGMQASITLDQEEFARSHPNTTFHSEPTVDGEVQQFTLPPSLKSRHVTSAIFHPNRTATTVLMTAPQTTVISQAETGEPVKYSHIDNIIQTPRYVPQNVNLNSVLVKDDGLTRFDGILTDTREIHLSNTASAIVHGNTTQVIRRVCYEDDKRSRFMIDEPESVIAGKDAKMVAEDSRDATLDSIADESSPERNTELFWESNSASERSESRRPLDFSSDSDKCCKSPLYDETNSTDSSGVGTHMRLDSVIKEARGVERSRSADGSSADDTHPPLRTYPPKRSYHNDAMDRNRYNDVDRSLSGKTRAGFQTEPRHHSPDISEVRRRASNRGVVKRGCHCCNGSPAPSRPKKSRQKKSHAEFSNNH